MKFLPSFVAALAVPFAAHGQSAPSSFFLPPPGHSYYYRYSETVTAPKTNVAMTATLTLETLADNNIRVTFAADGKSSRTLDLRVDETGALQPISEDPPDKKLRNRQEIQERAITQTLLLRLALISRVAAHRESSFPVALPVAWASGPVNPILTIKTTEPNVFVADAEASTVVNSPSADGSYGALGLGLRAAGTFGGAAVDGFVGIAGLGVSVLSVMRRHHGPQPAEVKLHLAGEIGDGRLKQLSGDQENVIRPGKNPTTSSDKWLLVAG